MSRGNVIMSKLLEELYYRYNDFDKTGHHIKSVKTVLRLMLENTIVTELDEKIVCYEREEIERKFNCHTGELGTLFNFEQPKSFAILILYIELVLNSIADSFFDEIKLERNKFKQIILSIALYYLFLQTYKWSDVNISSNAKKYLLKNESFLIGIEEIKQVCWEIRSKDLEVFLNLFAVDVLNLKLEDLSEEQLFENNNRFFILSIEKFLEYILFEVEDLYREKSSLSEFSKYQNRKGSEFEDIVYNFISPSFEQVVQSVYYYPNKNQHFEIDVLIKEKDSLIILECKSGTIELTSEASDQEIKQKIDNKVKKAYKTLENAAIYVQENKNYKFSNNYETVEGESAEVSVSCVHLSMYPIDSISSNVHTLNENYLSETTFPKITMSFEHFLAITLDCALREYPLQKYLSQRREYMLKFPKTKFDINEIDLYHQVTNKGSISMLTESIEKGILSNFCDNVQLFTSFKDSNGLEFRPAQDMIIYLDNLLLNMLLDGSLGLNKRFISYIKQYFQK